MAYKLADRMQQILLPAIIDDYVGPQDPVRVYDAFVEALDLKTLGIPMEPKPGADEYPPKAMLKLIIYSYSYGIRGSRKIERACYHNLAFQWLMGGQKPDYRTIARFRSEHKEAIKKVLKQCVRMCMKMDLIDGNMLFIDGSKFRANASINKTYDKERAEEAIKKIEQNIDEMIERSEIIDQQEEQESTLMKFKEQIHQKAEFINKMRDVLSELETTEKKSVNITDADAVKAKSRQGTHAMHNVQAAVDGKHGLIVNMDSVSQQDDSNQLSPQTRQAVEILEHKPEHVIADAKYSSVEDVKKIDPEINIVVPSLKQAQEDKGLHPVQPFDKKHFLYAVHTDEYVCPEGKNLKFKNFTPEGHKTYQAQGSECRACAHFGNQDSGHCTQSSTGRRVTRLKDEEFKERLEANYLKPENQVRYKLRKEKVEHPFGHMKRNLAAGQFMLRGKAKVDAEASILATCFNLTRMMTIIGIAPLIEKLSGA